MKRRKTLAEQIADLDDPAPKGMSLTRSSVAKHADFDPEEHNDAASDEASSGESVDAQGHYEVVGWARDCMVSAMLNEAERVNCASPTRCRRVRSTQARA